MVAATWRNDSSGVCTATCGVFALCAHPKLDGYGATVAFDGVVIARSPRHYSTLDAAKIGAYVLAEQLFSAAFSDVRLMRSKHPKPPRGVGYRGKKTAWKLC